MTFFFERQLVCAQAAITSKQGVYNGSTLRPINSDQTVPWKQSHVFFFKFKKLLNNFSCTAVF
jgi:hypothetical protein